MAQHTRDWEARFRAGDTPWEDDAAAPSVVDLVREHAANRFAGRHTGRGGAPDGQR